MSQGWKQAPKYLQITEEIRRQLVAGELKPGDRLPSFAQLRQRYGTTQNTVEKVFSLLEKDGLIVREPSRGTFVAPPPEPALARTQRTGIVGLYGSGFHFESYSSYWGAVLRGLRRGANQAGIQLLLLDLDSAAVWDKLDGVIACDYAVPSMLERVPGGLAKVSLLVDVPGTASLFADDYSGQRTATQHLLDKGHRKIAYLHGADTTVIPRRLAGYRDALMAAGVTPDSSWIRRLTGPYRVGADFQERGRICMQEWLEQGFLETGISGVLCHNDATALGVLQALAAHNLRVPGQVSVVGFDGTEEAAFAPIPLSTVVVPLEEMGRACVEMLCQQLETGRRSEDVRLEPVHLIERQSSGQFEGVSTDSMLKG